MTKEERYLEEEIDLRQLFTLVRKRRKWIVSITVTFIIVSALISFFFLTPIYQASTTIMVNKTFSESEILNQIQISDINVNVRLAETYSEIIKSRRIISRVIEDMDLDMTYEGLRSITQVSLVRDTELIDIKVNSPDPEMARNIANSTAFVFREEVVEIMNVDNVQILDSAVTPVSPIKPNKKMNIAIAGVLGLMISLGLVFLSEFLDRTIKSPEDIRRHLGLNVIGAIPNSEESHNRKIILFEDPQSVVSEAYRTLRTNLKFASLDKEIKTILVTSTLAGEGKSVTVSNLALSLVQSGSKVLLVDTDFRKPMLHKIAKRPNSEGLADILIYDIEHRNSIRNLKESNMDILFSGLIPPNPSELLGSNKMKDFIKEVRKEYDYVLFDSPPVALVTDAAVLASEVDATILVSAVGTANYEAAKRGVELLDNVNANIIGSVLNKIPIGKNSYYNYNYYSYYYGEYTNKAKKKNKKRKNK